MDKEFAFERFAKVLEGLFQKYGAEVLAEIEENVQAEESA